MASGWWRAAFGGYGWERARRITTPDERKRPDFTVVICTHDRPQMLRRALASALRQTHESYEIVVVDDASHPPAAVETTTGGVVRLARTPRRLGFAAAVNFGAARARGRWIALLDDDDEYEPDLLRRSRAQLQAWGERQFCLCSTVFLHYDGCDRPVRENVRRFPESYAREEDLLWETVSAGSGYGFVVNNEVFHQLGGFDDKNFWAIADSEFFYRLIAAGHRPAIVPEPLMRVHKHGGQRMTDATSYRNRAQQCKLLRINYADLIRQYPRLGERIRLSIEQLSALELAAQSHNGEKGSTT